MPDFVESVYPHDALEDLLPRADWVDICVPYTPETIDLIHDRQFGLMRPTAYILCTTRGGIINTDALVRALDAGQIAGAGLDVTDPEPPAADDPLLSLPNCVVVPHIASATISSRNGMAEIAANNLLAGLAGEPLPCWVNPEVGEDNGDNQTPDR